MTTYHRYERGRFGAGTIVIRIVRDGDRERAFLRTMDTANDEGSDAVYPSEQTTVRSVFRLAENKRMGSPGAEIVVELSPDVEWNPEWGSLNDDGDLKGSS